MPGVKLQTAVADNVVCLEHQGVFDVGVVDKLPDGRKERFHVLVDTVTDAGRQFLSDQAVALDGVRMRIDVSKRSLRGHDRPAEIHEAIHNLRHALQMHHGRWNPEEILRVRDLLNNTAKAIVDGPVSAQPAQENAE